MLTAEDKEIIRQLIREVVRKETGRIANAVVAKLKGNLPQPDAPLLPAERALEIKHLFSLPLKEANRLQIEKARKLRLEGRTKG